MWKGRFEEEPALMVQQFTQSLDLDWRMAEHDIRGSIAHVRMLAKVGLLQEQEAEKIEEGLRRVRDEIAEGRFVPSEALEDVHMNVESRLTELEPLGAKLHTARSRNDQTATTVRLFLRDRLIALELSLLTLLEVLLNRAEAQLRVIVSGYTHLQQAQPISMGHYWMAWFEAFARDCDRLNFALSATNECPLGAGALAGSTLPIDRQITSELLGFDCPTRNSLDTVGQRDYMADVHHFASMLALHTSRLAEDLIIWSSQEFGWLKLPDSFCTGSSMMPQKKNPDVLELIRGKTGQVLGHFMDLLITLKGLPMTYDRDLQEDKRGLWASLDTVEAILTVLSPMLTRTEVDAEAARAGLEKGFALATDVAEHLVLKGVPFRDAHWKVGQLVKYCLHQDKYLKDLSLDEWRELIPESGPEVLELLSLEASVERRNTYGGTGFEAVKLQITEGRERLARMKLSLEKRRKKWDKSHF
ncbi:MAG: argininosuccinate lyase [Fretibacterium sp.]|nr:argininosuccinate lyase [Fretibacterium sp.]